jgi:hypothetical protein
MNEPASKWVQIRGHSLVWRQARERVFTSKRRGEWRGLAATGSVPIIVMSLRLAKSSDLIPRGDYRTPRNQIAAIVHAPFKVCLSKVANERGNGKYDGKWNEHRIDRMPGNTCGAIG